MATESTIIAPPTAPEIALEPKPQEPQYIIPPHPEAHVVSDAQTVEVEAPTVADETLEEMVQSAVAGLRGELKAELSAELSLSKGGIEIAKS